MGTYSKAIAVNVLSFVAIVILLSIVAFVALYQWYEGQTLQTATATCIIKRTNYCIEWAKTNYDSSNPPYDWNSKSPFNCEKVNVMKPETGKECIGAGQQ